MKKRCRLQLSLALLTISSAGAQSTDSLKTPPLFRSESPLAVTIRANWKRIRDDRSEASPYRAATISYIGDDRKAVVVPLRVKTHGIWRLKHCDFPPLRFNISNKDTKKTLFHDLQKPKVVNTCKDSDQYEQLVLEEVQLYRIYQRLTPNSHRVRALRISYADSATGKIDATRYGFLFEDPDELADRLGGIQVKTKGATPADIDPEAGALVYLFQYLIGNTDFSFNGLHNGEVVMKSDGSPVIPVAYDFDFSGAVNAPYATPDFHLPIKRVRDRMFRGYCAFGADYPGAAEKMRAKKSAIYALYADEIGSLIKPDYVHETLAYFDQFFDDIKTDRDAKGVYGNCVR